MENRSLVTIAGHSKEKILYLLEMAREFEKKPNRSLLDGKIVATLFFEPSTRTRLSFETAANRLGAKVIGFTDPKVTSSSKGETLKDTIMMVSNYADIIVMRHYLEGAARYASEVTKVPVVNAGDGANQHPSQTMLDLYSIYKTQGTLENLNIYMVGDLKYGRTVHSLLMAMRHFNGRKRGCRAIGQQALLHDADTYVASGICSAGVLPQTNVLAALRRRFMKSDFDRQPARNIRGFWCYRTREQTLIFVRLRASIGFLRTNYLRNWNKCRPS